MRMAAIRDFLIVLFLILGMVGTVWWYADRFAAERRKEDRKALLEQQLNELAMEQQKELHAILKDILENVARTKKAQAEGCAVEPSIPLP